MATTPTKNYYNPDLSNYLSNTSVSFGSGATGNPYNTIQYTGSYEIDTIAVKMGTSTSVSSATVIRTFIGDVTRQRLTLTKTKSRTYVFFQFLSGSAGRGYVRFYMNDSALPNGTYYIYLDGVLIHDKIIHNIMIYLDEYTDDIDWTEFHSPIACTTDFSAGSSDTNKSVFIYNSSTGNGKATTSSSTTLTATLWSTNFTHTYSNGQAIRYCDIRSVS